MPFISWDDSYCVNIQKIDEQHKGLVKLVGELQRAMSQSAASAVLGNVLSSLIDYTIIHFKTEEELLQKHGYPALEQHKHEHARLTARVMEFQGKFSEGKSATTYELMDFLSDWLLQHILDSDKKYSSYINASGAT